MRNKNLIIISGFGIIPICLSSVVSCASSIQSLDLIVNQSDFELNKVHQNLILDSSVQNSYWYTKESIDTFKTNFNNNFSQFLNLSNSKNNIPFLTLIFDKNTNVNDIFYLEGDLKPKIVEINNDKETQKTINFRSFFIELNVKNEKSLSFKNVNENGELVNFVDEVKLSNDRSANINLKSNKITIGFNVRDGEITQGEIDLIKNLNNSSYFILKNTLEARKKIRETTAKEVISMNETQKKFFFEEVYNIQNTEQYGWEINYGKSIFEEQPTINKQKTILIKKLILNNPNSAEEIVKENIFLTGFKEA